ncbi:MAG: CHAT domain-containing protein [Rhodospirillaceae bacterium]|nr:CHAT domain-containing protein [Rhodospirillaceae bacterium]MBT5191014.1 CHAT domain-containing protein [Rhodospirillaceae bacterium]MBT5894503.1 CHAT domain-containing protein [Rhodospirillaceae bacterium]
MKRLFLTLLLVWPLVVFAPLAAAQSPGLMAAYRQYEALTSKGKYAEAVQFARNALELGKNELGPTHQTYAVLLNNLADLYGVLGRYDEAVPLYGRSLAILEKALGPEHTSIARLLNNLAKLHYRQSRFREAEPLYKRSLAIREKAYGSDHSDVARSLNNLAALYLAQGRYGIAEPLYRRSLAIYKKVHGPDHTFVAASLNNLAELYRVQGRYGEAEPLYERALAMREKSLGPSHPKVAALLGNLAVLYYNQGRYGEAGPLYRRALAIYEKTNGPHHAAVAAVLNNLAELYRAQGRSERLEPIYKRSLAINEKALGPEHTSVGTLLNNLAALYRSQGRYDEAEPIYRRSLAIKEKTLGPGHPDVATSLNNLAGLYRAQGRHGQVERLYKRSLAIQMKTLGPDHPNVAWTLSNLAELYRLQGRNGEAETLHKRAQAIIEKALGPDHPSLAISFSSLAVLYRTQGRYAEAEPLYKRSLATLVKAFGPNSSDVATSLNNLAGLYLAQGRYGEAESAYERSLAIREKVLGPDNPDVATSLNNLAVLYRTQGKTAQSLSRIRRAVDIRRDRAIRTGGGKGSGRLSEQKSIRYVFLFHVHDTLAMSNIDMENRVSLVAEGFESGQLATASSAGAAVSRMAARFAVGDDKLADLMRARQDAAARWRQLDGALVKAVSQPAGKRDLGRESALRRALARNDDKIMEIDARLEKSFPQFAELTAPKPVPLLELQGLLARDEALLTYLVWDDRSFVFAVRQDRVMAKEIKLGANELTDAVTALRKGLDPVGVETLADIPPFDTTKAFALYRKLFQPVEQILQGARHVFVVPGGALQSLPLGVLVTEAFNGKTEALGDYRKVPWLARNYAMTTLPSVSSLKALRTFARRAKASRPFLGVGDPKLEGETGSNRGVALTSLFTARGVADVSSVRGLPSLPDSYDELRSMARSLNVDDAALLVGGAATETALKKMKLSEFKVVTFATHGLVAGDLGGLAEPALVLTPPKVGSALDDGLLTAGEVAQLKLDADWVILSACNTAAGDGTPGAEGLSGLAKAFFYAGARSLLVSHWPVASDAAVRITTRTLKEMQVPGVGRAEAHQRAMLALIESSDRPHYAHPLFWAPFVVVGEGGPTQP